MAERRRYRLPPIAEFRQQLRFAGRSALRKQALAAESLLFEIARDRVYPVSWVVWRITGFRPEGDQLADAVLDGEDLRHDLAVFLQELAAELDFKHSDRPHGAVESSEAASRLGVTVRTLQRWRRYGLPLIPIRLADGRRRKGCFLDTLERFAAAEATLVERARRFGRVNSVERAKLQALVSHHVAEGLPGTVAARIVADEIGRSSGAVRRAARLGGRRLRLPGRIGELLLRAHNLRISETRLAERLQRSPATIRRLISQSRRDRARALRPPVIELPTASLPDAEEIFATAGELDQVADRLVGIDAPSWLAEIRALGSEEHAGQVGNRIAAMHFLHGRAASATDALPGNPGERALDPVERDLGWSGRLLERTVIGIMYAAVRRYEQSVQVRLDTFEPERITSVIEVLLGRVAVVVRGFDPTRRGTIGRLERSVGLEVARAVASDSTLQDPPVGWRRTIDSMQVLPPLLRGMLLPVRWWRAGGGVDEDSESRRLIEVRHGVGGVPRPHSMKEAGRVIGMPPTRLLGPLLSAERAMGTAARRG